MPNSLHLQPIGTMRCVSGTLVNLLLLTNPIVFESKHLVRLFMYHTLIPIRNIAFPIQMRYNITSRGVGARHCRVLNGVPHVNENRYILPLDAQVHLHN
jgi:hypothetical protein